MIIYKIIKENPYVSDANMYMHPDHVTAMKISPSKFQVEMKQN